MRAEEKAVSRFLKSVKYALRGILYCINNERNMRFHTVATFFSIVMSPFFHLTRGEYALLFLTCGTVMAAEVFNTVSEKLCDAAMPGYSHGVRAVKDLAAGGVLIAAVFAFFVAWMLFARPAEIAAGWMWLVAHPWVLVILFVLAAAAVPYVLWGPPGIRDRIRRGRDKRNAAG